MKHSRMMLISAVLLSALTAAAAAQSDQRIVVPLADPLRPAILDVSLIRGSVSVIGYDGDDIAIVLRDPPQRIVPEPSEAGTGGDRTGLRRIPNTGIGLTAEEHDNTVSIQMDSAMTGTGLDISVPRRTSVRARAVNNGDLTVEGVTGEHELSNVNGGIRAADISGSAVLNTTNGSVEVSFSELTPDKPMSFTSFNGDIEVVFPADLAADLRISTNRGDVFTDFDVEMQPQQPTVERSDNAGRYRVRLEREIRATVGGGGPEIRFKTFNGDIVIRKR